MKEKESPSTASFRHAVEAPPTPPVEPEALDCCGEGCVRCVFDVYDEALQRYRSAMAVWNARQPK